MALHAGATNYRIGHVISNTPDAPGLSWATQVGIPHTVIARSSYDSLGAFKSALVEAVQRTQPDIVALAGFMVVLNTEFIEAFQGRLINIHPSLLPKYRGANAAAQALAAGDKITGCTVHYVDTGVDTGEIIAQREVPVEPGDTADTLQARIQAAEHELLPSVIASFAAHE